MNRNIRMAIAGILALALLYSAYGFYMAVKPTAENFAPNIYTQQWQRAMSWVRENTPENAVFGHWWDYGYWLQSIGKRATVLDGGNAIGYWNHLMGRYALTGTDNMEALNFLYAHNTTHFLIDSTDIGKYGAFSSIGSGIEMDRVSYIPSLFKDLSQSRETKNGTLYVYPAGVGLDSDIIYQQNGSKIFLPAGKAGLGAVLIELGSDGKISEQPTGVFVYQNRQYSLPLRYAYQNSFKDFGSGVEAGVFIVPRLFNSQQGQQLDNTGALLYLSGRTVKSQLARLYLYDENNNYFKLAHTEDDVLVSQMKDYGVTNSSFVFYDQFRGPIKIWEISYPAGMKVNQTYLQTNYPDKRLDSIV